MPGKANMSDDQGPKRLPEFIAENWDVRSTQVVIEEDGMRVIIELLPRVDGEEPQTLEFFSKPF
jgi:hypothetical protein